MGIFEMSIGGVLSFFFFFSFCAAAGVAHIRKSAKARRNRSDACKMRAAGRIAKYFFIRVQLLWQKRIARRFEPGSNGAQLVYFVREAPSTLTNRRYAPGTPSGSCRKKARPV